MVVIGTFKKLGNGGGVAANSPWGLLSVDEWGATGTTDLAGAFAHAGQLTRVAGIPRGVTDLSYAFASSGQFNDPIGDWDTSRVADMSYLFRGSGFNRQIGDWNVAHVKDMALAVAVRTTETGEWLRRDGTFGAYQKIETALSSPGAHLTDWSFQRPVPAGKYGVTLIVIDRYFNRNPEPRPWRLVEVD